MYINKQKTKKKKLLGSLANYLINNRVFGNELSISNLEVDFSALVPNI